MNIYDNNKQLLTTIGGNANNYSTDYEVRKALLDTLGGDSSMCSNIYEVDLQILKIFQEGGGAGGGEKVKVLTLDINNSCIVDGTWGAESIDTSLMTSFSDLFYGCSSLTQVDVSNWNTNNVKDMQYLFCGCSSLQSVGDLSNWDVSKVNYMQRMFYDCKNLQSVGDLSNWDVSNVWRIDSMFCGCYSLQTLDVSNWNTSKVTNMSQVFSDCHALQQLDLTNWDASKVTSISNFMSVSVFNSNLTNVVGGRTIDEVIANNITILNNLSIGGNYILGDHVDRASFRALINGLADNTGVNAYVLKFYSIRNLTEEDIAIATEKNWTSSA